MKDLRSGYFDLCFVIPGEPAQADDWEELIMSVISHSKDLVFHEGCAWIHIPSRGGITLRSWYTPRTFKTRFCERELLDIDLPRVEIVHMNLHIRPGDLLNVPQIELGLAKVLQHKPPIGVIL